jgi:hypothetical protein
MTHERREVLAILAELSALHPEMRMGQWMTLFATAARGAQVESIYDVEDEELVPVMRSFLEKRRSEATVASGSS